MSNNYKYDIAISFAEQDKVVAQKLSEALQSYTVNLKVYNYLEKRAQQFGVELMDNSEEVYQGQARHIIILVSKHYDTQGWASIEWKLIKAEARRRPYRYLLIVRIDETTINGLDDDIVYEVWNNNAMDLANIIKQVVDKDSALPTGLSTKSTLPTEPKKSTTRVPDNPKNKISLFKRFLIGLSISMCTAIITGLWVQMSENYRLSFEPWFIHEEVLTPEDCCVNLELIRSEKYADYSIYVNSKKIGVFRDYKEKIECLQVGSVVEVGIETQKEFVIKINKNHLDYETIQHKIY